MIPYFTKDTLPEFFSFDVGNRKDYVATYNKKTRVVTCLWFDDARQLQKFEYHDVSVVLAHIMRGAWANIVEAV